MGEYVVSPSGTRCEVVRREGGDDYAVWVRSEDDGQVHIITYFAQWLKQGKWKLEEQHPISND
ncbi:MAG: hypothetical protein GEU26_18820 [Nitrososphaeraceae archaeon]|nr:hypothetical protein [Nitrososphaeraceae archaeon]